MKYLVLMVGLHSSLLSAQTIISIDDGSCITSSPCDWLDNSTWDLGRVPQDNDIILIETDDFVEISGDAITLDNVQLVIRGTLVMDNAGFNVPNLSLTGSGSGVFVEEDGRISERMGALQEPFSFITIDGTPIWSACTNGLCLAAVNAVLDPDVEINGNYTGPAGGTGLPSTFSNPLPVEFLFMSATYSNEGVLLEWATATEETNSHFEIQRSFDTQTFEVLDVIEGAGDSKVRIDYSYIDREAGNLRAENLYYRLRQVDFDGKYDYSKTVVARSDDFVQPEIVIWPNPFANSATITINADLEDEIELSIIDLNGKEVIHKEWFIYEGRNDLDVTELQFVQSGSYIVQLRGRWTYLQERLIKAQ